MARTNLKTKEPVRIRYRRLKNGNKSLFLDIYNEQHRRYKFLKLYLIPETSEEAKKQNVETNKVALYIKMQQVLEILNNKAGINSMKKNKISLISWMEQSRDSLIKNGKRISSTYNNTIKLLKAFRGDDVLLKDIDVKYCMDFYHFLLTTPTKKTGKPLAINSIVIYTTCLSTALQRAVRFDYISANPYKRIAPCDKVRKNESTCEYLTIDELKMLANTPCRHKIIKQAFMFATFTALRLSDIERLQWQNIKKQPNGQYRIEIIMQKTQTPIYLPLANEALQWLPERNGQVEDDRVFPLLSRTTINSVLKTWASAAGIAPAKASRIHFHVSRGTFCTNMLTLGCDIYTVSKLVGHKTIAMTTRYAKVVDQKKVDAVNLLNDILK